MLLSLEGIWDFLQDPIYQIILIVIGAVIGEVATIAIFRAKDSPKIVIKPTWKKEGL